MNRAVIWDLDGTLIDSLEYHWRAWRDTLRAEGLALTREQFLASFGQRNDSILERWLGADASPERVQRIGDAKEATYRRLVEGGGISPLPGVAEWVRRLDASGWLQAIASSAPRLNVEAVVAALGFEGYFRAIVSAEDVRRGKPDPQVFLLAASTLGVLPAQCIVVEDAQVGIEAARRAGMRSIGVGRNDLSSADVAVSSLAALAPDAFDRLLDRPSGHML